MKKYISYFLVYMPSIFFINLFLLYGRACLFYGFAPNLETAEATELPFATHVDIVQWMLWSSVLAVLFCLLSALIARFYNKKPYSKGHEIGLGINFSLLFVYLFSNPFCWFTWLLG